MKKISVLFTICIFLVLASCNKDQEAVKKLDGTWEEVSINGTAVPDSSKGSYNFENCKLKTEEYCTAVYTSADGNALTSEYQVKEKGTILALKIEDPTFGGFTLNSKIDELTESKLVLSTTLPIINQTTTTEYKKK